MVLCELISLLLRRVFCRSSATRRPRRAFSRIAREFQLLVLNSPAIGWSLSTTRRSLSSAHADPFFYPLPLCSVVRSDLRALLEPCEEFLVPDSDPRVDLRGQVCTRSLSFASFGAACFRPVM